MRLVALSVGDGKFTVMGSVFIVLIYVVAMAPLAVAATITVRWWRWLFGAGGSVFLLFPAIGVAGEEIGHVGDGRHGVGCGSWPPPSACSPHWWPLRWRPCGPSIVSGGRMRSRPSW